MCLGPELRNYYSRFFRGFPLRRFEFIGITEHFESDLADFARRFLGRPLEPVRDNANPRRGVAGYEIDPALRRRIEVFHAGDVALYREALRRRDLRLRESLAPISHSHPSIP
ncbi:MAG: hypothetical protein FJ385_01900 [Verrucomicrobia bacterium]|nr:hypothetical protein [Verrucomicrobiota bacterium]